MKKIENIADQMRGVVTYDLGNGQYVTLDARDVREYGLETILRDLGVEMPTERIPVMQYGKRVGSVPADFDIAFARSKSPFYDVRPGDLVREGDVWVAGRGLGARDLDCLVGFRRDEGHEKRQKEIRDDTLAALGKGTK